MSNWISVETELPKGRCLVFVESKKGSEGRNRMHVAVYHKNIDIVGNLFAFDMPPVTHWMPLPEPPKETKQ